MRLQNNALSRPVNKVVLTQHAEEAAFYWVRREAGLWSPAFDKSDFARMDGLVKANLSGLRIAGPVSNTVAIQNLTRWKTADEAFVSTYALALVPDSENLEVVEALIDEMPTLICGAAAALHWAGAENNQWLVQRWFNSKFASLKRAAFPAMIASSNDKEAVARAGLSDPSPAIRARALRAVGEWRIKDCLSVANDAITDSYPECRFEASIASYTLGQKPNAEVALEAMNELNERKTPDDPIAKQFSDSAKRRRLLFWSWMCEEQDFITWIETALDDPLKCQDAIWSLTFRGERMALDYLESLLREDRESTLAAYALSHITGLDLETSGFYQANESEPEADDEVESDSEIVDADLDDDGLLEPDVEKVLAWLIDYKSNFLLTSGQRYLGGLPIAQSAQKLLQDGTQPQRWQSALYLSRMEQKADCLVGLRAPSD